MNTITTPDFMGRIAKIVEEIRTQTCIEEILQDELEEVYSLGYDDGHSDGYENGFDDGSEGHY